MELDVQEIYLGNMVKDEGKGTGVSGENLQVTMRA